jgi:CheY-like chemotaxis protein
MPGDNDSAIRVLVVDDNEDMLLSIQLLLGRAGFQVEVAPNGVRAVEVQRERPVQVMITDLLMPEQDGIEIIENFRREFPAVRIIAMSGGGRGLEGARYLKTAGLIGADVLMRKPVEAGELLRTLRKLITGDRRGPA